MGKLNSIMADCVCDLSNDFIRENEIDIVHFYLHVGERVFTDGHEISYANVIEHYAENGTMIISNPPSAEEYAAKYRKWIEKGLDVIHFTISDQVSDSYKKASLGRELLGDLAEHVYIVDTQTLSNGMALFILKALELNKAGKSAQEIVAAMKAMLPMVDTSFVAQNADNLAINGRVTSLVAKVFKLLRIRPIFSMKGGKLKVGGFEHGGRASYIKRHVKHRLRRSGKIDLDTVFIVHAGCTAEEVATIVAEVKERCNFKHVYVNKTSATVTCNCGAGAFAVIYKRQ